MIDYGALGANTAGSRAGIYALLIVASHVGGTVGADNALRSAIGR